MRVLLTGSAGFIGRNLRRFLAQELGSASLVTLDRVAHDDDDAPGVAHHALALADPRLDELVAAVAPDAVIHLAAETHVDRSIADAEPFLLSNVLGTWHLLEAVRRWLDVEPGRRTAFRFVHVSTDEVFGDAGQGEAFREHSRYRPRNPYSASKAAADHLVEAWSATYGLRAVILHPSNNYGPWQHPEKLIPGTLLRLLEREPVPLYGDGRQAREWLWVGDFCAAVGALLARPEVTGRFVLGSGERVANLDLVRLLCTRVAARTGVAVGDLLALVTHVDDRPGHDRCYRLDSGHIQDRLGWRPRTDLHEGLERTIDWAIDHRAWLLAMRQGSGTTWATRQP